MTKRRLQISSLAAAGVVAVLAVPSSALAERMETGPGIVLAQAMVPPTGMGEEDKAMAAKHMAEVERMQRRFPQPVRVGDLIGLPVIDLNASTLGYVDNVVRTAQGQIEIVVSYSRWWGWFGRPVAVPIEVVGIEGRHLVSLDMPPSAYVNAPSWCDSAAKPLPVDAMIRIALARS